MKFYSNLKGNLELLNPCNNIVIVQKESSIVEEVKSPSLKGKVHYLPHHSVIMGDKRTSKVKIVFDTSSQEKGSILYACLHKGPQTTTLTFDVLLRFRTFKIAFVADIEKAFL